MSNNDYTPLVTVITPVFNRASFLDETIQSVLSQDYSNIEYIILDDGSTDNTQEVLSKYQGKFYWESHKNIGETRTVNKGIRMAKGEVICVVNSDDPLLPGAISEAVQILKQNPLALAAYPDWLEIDTDSKPIKELHLPDYNLWNMLRDFNVSIGPGTFIRSKAFEIVGLRDETLIYVGDLEFWFRLAVYNGLIHIPKILATHRTHQASASFSGKGARMAGEIVIIVDKLFSNRMLPKWARKLRRYSLSTAHRSAIYYCGTDWVSETKHRFASIFFNPFIYSYRCAYSGVDSPIRSRIHRKIWWILTKFGAKAPLPPQDKPITNPGRIAKFGFVSHVLPPSWSGQAVVIERLLNSLDPNDYCLISIRDYSQVAPEENNRRLKGKYFCLAKEPKLFSSSRYKLLRWSNTVIRILYRGYSIARIARAEQCKTILVGTGDLLDLPAAFCASVILGINFVPYLFDDYTFQWTDPNSRSIAKWAEKLIFPRSTKIIVPNELLRDLIFERHGIIPVIIRNPSEEINYSSIDETITKKNISDIVKIVYTGEIYLVNIRALRNIISALTRITEKSYQLHIYTAQPISWLKREGISGEGVVIHQHVPPDELAEAQSNANILLVPFSFNSTVLEIIKTSAPGKLGDYLASGTPILAHVPPESFVSWYLKKYDCGMVVEQENPDILAEAICRLSKDQSFSDSIVHNAMARAITDFQPGRSRETFMRLLENMT